MARSTRHNTPPVHPYQPHVVVEIAEQTAHDVHKTEIALKGVRLISGFEAFRKYDWLQKAAGSSLRGMAVLNKAGNLRAMVISLNAQAVFNLTSNALEKLDKYSSALAVAGVALNLYNDKNKIAAIAASNEPGEAKASQYCLFGSMAIIRAVTGIVPMGADLLARSIEGYIDIADLATGHSATTQNMLKAVRAADARVTSTYDQITDAENAYHLINTHLFL